MLLSSLKLPQGILDFLCYSLFKSFYTTVSNSHFLVIVCNLDQSLHKKSTGQVSFIKREIFNNHFIIRKQQKRQFWLQQTMRRTVIHPPAHSSINVAKGDSSSQFWGHNGELCTCVVYFDQLLGAVHIRKLVETLYT